MDKDPIKLACEMVGRGLGNSTCDSKQLAIEAFDIRVWIKHNELATEGSMRCFALGKCKLRPSSRVE